MSKSVLSNSIIFLTGAALGSLLVWKYTKTKYEVIAQEEINSIREYYASKYKGCKNESIESITNDIYNKIVTDNHYGAVIEEDDDMPKPYVIEPDEFGEAGYETISLTYYSDGVLTDDDDKLIENVDELVGEDSLNHFGEYEDDSVFVRNDEKRTDYEILLDLRNYYEIYPKP